MIMSFRLCCLLYITIYTLDKFLLILQHHAFSQAINIEGLSLDKFLEYHAANSGWIIEKGGQSQVIVFPRNEVNHPELKKNTADTVPFEHITRIFPVLS
jgi:translation initiation factor 3 subunit K